MPRAGQDDVTTSGQIVEAESALAVAGGVTVHVAFQAIEAQPDVGPGHRLAGEAIEHPPGQPRRRVQLVTSALRPGHVDEVARGRIPLGLHPDLVLAGQHADAEDALVVRRRLQQGRGITRSHHGADPAQDRPGAAHRAAADVLHLAGQQESALPQPQRHLGRLPGLDRDFIPMDRRPLRRRRRHGVPAGQHVVQPEPAAARGHRGAWDGAGEARQLVLAPVASDRHDRPIDGLPVAVLDQPGDAPRRLRRIELGIERCHPLPFTLRLLGRRPGTALRPPQPPEHDPAHQHGAQHQCQDREPTTRSLLRHCHCSPVPGTSVDKTPPEDARSPDSVAGKSKNSLAREAPEARVSAGHAPCSLARG